MEETKKNYDDLCIRINSKISANSDMYNIINSLMKEYDINSTAELAKRCIRFIYENNVDISKTSK